MAMLYYTHPACKLHEMGEGHPECPARLDAINDRLLSSGVADLLLEREAPRAAQEALLRVHTVEYLESLMERAPAAGYAELDPDTVMNPHTYEAALRAAGAAIAAVDAVLAGEGEAAFCAVRPPGHHACPDRAMGFCFLNNVAIAARHAMAHHGLERIAVIDFDVHHGNGTEAALAGDPRVLMCGFFQHPFYPFSGADPWADNMLNQPLPAYTEGAAVRELVTSRWLPRLERFKPQLVLISAGFDAHREDDLGRMGLVEADFAWMTEQLGELAGRHGARMVSCLEGGYNLSALGRSVTAHIRALAGI
ncbi:histone deacetylase family protein [Pigmentiphaga humi]